jgi:signal peptidase I
LNRMKAFFREVLLTLAIAIVLFFGLQLMVQSYIIKESSMEPNFYEGERLLVNKVTYRFNGPQMGDVIVFHPPPPYNQEGTNFIKRVIALPGDTVEVRGEAVYVNGVKLDEPYVTQRPDYTLSLETVPEGSYFVLGDNRNVSNDSHTGWVVPRQNIVGRAWIILWPPVRWGLAPNYPLQQELAGSTA